MSLWEEVNSDWGLSCAVCRSEEIDNHPKGPAQPATAAHHQAGNSRVVCSFGQKPSAVFPLTPSSFATICTYLLVVPPSSQPLFLPFLVFTPLRCPPTSLPLGRIPANIKVDANLTPSPTRNHQDRVTTTRPKPPALVDVIATSGRSANTTPPDSVPYARPPTKFCCVCTGLRGLSPVWLLPLTKHLSIR